MELLRHATDLAGLLETPLPVRLDDAKPSTHSLALEGAEVVGLGKGHCGALMLLLQHLLPPQRKVALQVVARLLQQCDTWPMGGRDGVNLTASSFRQILDDAVFLLHVCLVGGEQFLERRIFAFESPQRRVMPSLLCLQLLLPLNKETGLGPRELILQKVKQKEIEVSRPTRMSRLSVVVHVSSDPSRTATFSSNTERNGECVE
jgi:hypothetical protein